MISRILRDQNIIFDILVRNFLTSYRVALIYALATTEPLESELAVQVEYDMDEQGPITLSLSSSFYSHC